MSDRRHDDDMRRRETRSRGEARRRPARYENDDARRVPDRRAARPDARRAQDPRRARYDAGRPATSEPATHRPTSDERSEAPYRRSQRRPAAEAHRLRQAPRMEEARRRQRPRGDARRSQAAQSRRPRRPPVQPARRGGALPVVIGIVVVIAAICVIRFVACAPHPDDPTRGMTSTTSEAIPSGIPDPALTADERDRLMESDSANDVRPTEKVVYLTFDDGPSGHTQQILDTLDEYGVKATWFVIGDTGHLDYVNEIWDRGHQIGLHSYDHDYERIYADPQNFVADIDRIGSAVEGYLGFMPRLIRFPGGSANGYDAGRVGEFTQAATSQGWHYFDWNVSIGDSTQPPAPAEALVANVEREAEGCNSCCVLMHDSDFKPTTPDALPQVIEYFQSLGFTFDVLVADSFGYHF